MKPLCLTVFSGLCCLLAFSQPGKRINDANAQKRTVAAFHSIHTQDGIDLYLTQGDEDAVAVSASSVEYRDKIISRVENGVLYLSFQKNGLERLWSNRKLRAYISFKNLDALKASGGSDVYVERTLQGNNLDIQLSGGSDLTASINCTLLRLDQAGGSDSDLSGKVTTMELMASGGSDCDANNLTVDYATIEASGGSDVTITVNRELNASSTGGSDLYYRGNPVVKKSTSGGGGSIHKRG
ncbi:MAG TPA: head GIN domain-containing protein [Flavitalea sp.]|nr:head GIN domain-containing protein [Flavitalea sp.]